MNTALGADPADLAEIEKIVRTAGTSFYHGMRILPPDRRAAMYAIYAFCRIVDDIADEPAPITQKREQLDAWRTRIAALAHNTTDGPVTRVLLLATRAFALREQDFAAIIDGMQTDAETTILAPSLAELDTYSDQVASAVGRLSVRAFGDSSPAADQVAHHLGRALQLTNILRDISEDAERGRLYFPREWLDQYGIPANAEAAVKHPNLPLICARMAALAHEHFSAATTTMKQCDHRAMRPARLMAATYAAVLTRLEKRGWANPGDRVSVPAWRKLWLAIWFGALQ